MEWPRVKNILIVLLALVNAFLFIVYITSNISDARAEQETRLNVVSVLSKSAFSIDESLIPGKRSVLYPLSVERNLKNEDKIAKSFLGSFQKFTQSGGAVLYTSELGEVQFKPDGSFEITLKNSINLSESSDITELVFAVAKKLKISVAEQIEIFENPYGTHARTIQLYSGVPVYNCDVNVVLKSDKSIKINGRILSKGANVLRGEAPRDVTGLLLDLVEDLNKNGITSGKIESIRGGFNLDYTMGGSAIYAVPVWEFTVSGNDFYINAMNGETVVPNN